MKRKIVVSCADFGEDYHYNAQIWCFVHDKWWYGGAGRYCKTIEEVLKYAQNLNLSVEFC